MLSCQEVKSEVKEQYFPSLFFVFGWLLRLLADRHVGHVALDEDTGHFLLTVGENLNVLLEGARQLA